MPLILLGLIVIAGIIIYALVMYGNSDDQQTDTRPVRERYAHIFEKFKKEPNYTVVDDGSGSDDAAENEQSGSHTMYFPADAESEKRRRNIK